MLASCGPSVADEQPDEEQIDEERLSELTLALCERYEECGADGPYSMIVGWGPKECRLHSVNVALNVVNGDRCEDPNTALNYLECLQEVPCNELKRALIANPDNMPMCFDEYTAADDADCRPI